MRDKLARYTVTIEDRPFEIDETNQFAQTALVSYLDEKGAVIDTVSYGYLPKETIYEKIHRGEPVELNNVYVRDFSLREYKSKYDIANSDLVPIKDWMAINAFFDASEETNFERANFTGDVTHWINAIFAHGNVNFMHARFEEGAVDFTQALFHVPEVNFRYVRFGGEQWLFKDTRFFTEVITFVNARFGKGQVSFAGANFGSARLRFQFTRFEGDLSFEKARFRGKRIDFGKAEFGSGKLDFRLCDFGDSDLIFDESEFEGGKMRFVKARFGVGRVSFYMCQMGRCEVSFARTEFGSGKMSFHQSICRSLSFRDAHLNNFIDMRLKQCDELDLSGAIVRDIIDFTNEDGDVQFGVVNFKGVRTLGRFFISWKNNGVYEMIHRQKDVSFAQKAEQFRMMKEEFRRLGQYNDEDRAYLEFKRLELKSRTRRVLKKSKLNALWLYPFTWCERLIFDTVGHYATNPVRVLVSMFIAYWLFTLTYVFLGHFTSASIVSSIGDPDHLSLFARSVYHSAITFLTIGYGDYYPSGSIRWISSLEGFAGLFLMSYFTVAFVRKILR